MINIEEHSEYRRRILFEKLFVKNSSVNSVQINNINNNSVLHWFKSRLVTSITLSEHRCCREVWVEQIQNDVSLMTTKYITSFILAMSSITSFRPTCCVKWLMPCTRSLRQGAGHCCPDVKQHITSSAKNKTEEWNKLKMSHVTEICQRSHVCVWEGYF